MLLLVLLSMAGACTLPLSTLADPKGRYQAVVPESPQFGHCSIDQFELAGVLGRGNFGLVREAIHTRSGRRVAIKFQQHASSGWHLFSRNEECILHELSQPHGHPFITEHYCTLALANGTVGYVMELVTGHNFRQIIKNRVAGRSVKDLALPKIMAQLAVTLDHIHGKGIVMADMTADNIMITASGDIKMMDFGLAIKIFPDGSVLKEPQWVAHGVLPAKAKTAAVDWYAYGLVLFEALNGVGLLEQLRGKSFALSPLLRGEFCPKHFDPDACSFIKQFNAVPWSQVWGTSEETRQLLRDHAYFKGLNWRDLHGKPERE